MPHLPPPPAILPTPAGLPRSPNTARTRTDHASASSYHSSCMLTVRRIPGLLFRDGPAEPEIVRGARENRVVTTVEEDRTQARIHGLLEVLREAEAGFRSYARALEVVAELDAENTGAVAGFGTTARLLTGVLNLSKGEAKARAEQAGLLTPRRSLTGEVLPATAAELAAGAIGPIHLRVITAVIRGPYCTGAVHAVRCLGAGRGATAAAPRDELMLGHPHADRRDVEHLPVFPAHLHRPA